jgi:hypothetical protein
MHSANDVIERLKMVFNAGSDQALSSFIGASKTTISSWRQRDSIPYAVCIRVAQEKGITLDWLLTGVEPMYRSQIAAPAGRSGLSPTYAEEAPPIDQTVINTARLLEELTPTQRREIFDDIEEKKRLNTIERELDELKQELRKIAG